MEIRIHKESDVSIHQQLVQQIVFLIASDRLKPGELLPSVRQLARQVRIHHNTVSQAYQELVGRKWLVRKRGSRLAVRSGAGDHASGSIPDLDDLINAAIQMARLQGFSLQALRKRVRQRLLAEPPDHILLVEQEAGLRRLLEEELSNGLRWPVANCSRAELAAKPGLALGALVVCAQYADSEVRPLIPKDRPFLSLRFSDGGNYQERLRQLQQPSVIGLISVSELFLKIGKAVLAPAVGANHSLAEFRFPLSDASALQGVDWAVCDSIAASIVKHPRLVPYRLISAESLAELHATIRSYRNEEGISSAKKLRPSGTPEKTLPLPDKPSEPSEPGSGGRRAGKRDR